MSDTNDLDFTKLPQGRPEPSPEKIESVAGDPTSPCQATCTP